MDTSYPRRMNIISLLPELPYRIMIMSKITLSSDKFFFPLRHWVLESLPVSYNIYWNSFLTVTGTSN